MRFSDGLLFSAVRRCVRVGSDLRFRCRCWGKTAIARLETKSNAPGHDTREDQVTPFLKVLLGRSRHCWRAPWPLLGLLVSGAIAVAACAAPAGTSEPMASDGVVAATAPSATPAPPPTTVTTQGATTTTPASTTAITRAATTTRAPTTTQAATTTTTRAPTTTITENCTPGYDPCLPPASDYDCAGGSGNGPMYTGRVRVTGSDPYDLDRDNDGWGCD